jgi:sugar lactone lactonase YvrE
VVLPEEGWRLVGEGYRFTEGPAVNARGEVFFNDVGAGKTYRVDVDGKVSIFLEDSRRGDGQEFGPDGRLYANAGATQQVIAWDGAGQPSVIAEGVRGNDLVVLSDGGVYVTDPFTTPGKSKLIHIDAKGGKREVDAGLLFANGVTVSPDQTLLYVADSRSHWVYSYQVQPDGTLKHKQRYYHLHVPDHADDSGVDGLCVDRDGRLYAATRMGVQVCDQAGRVNFILPTPNGKAANLTLGGPAFDTLFVCSGDKVYSRKLKVKAAPAWDKPVKPQAPRL